MTKDAGNPFWDFSLSVYALDGVSEACLRLQDQHGVDVNLLLYCCWVAQDACLTLAEADMAKVIGRVSEWKAHVVIPLRAARRALKGETDGIGPAAREALRDQVKQAELEAERLQQDALFDALKLPAVEPDRVADRRVQALANLECYFRAQPIDTDARTSKDIAIILDAVFSNGS
ncbi:MAG: TIGR02444 family protein [Alphaproteobacteria bacterium]|nr:TIGR02444 family protein [Alphaproteobacteria bacterium]